MLVLEVPGLEHVVEVTRRIRCCLTEEIVVSGFQWKILVVAGSSLAVD